MDVLLQNGDPVLDHRGRPVMVTGARELLQRAAIRLTVRRGSLPHDPAFGSRLHCLRAQNGEARDRQALLYVREALAPIGGLAVRGVQCAGNPENGRLTVAVRLACEGEGHRLEVSV